MDDLTDKQLQQGASVAVSCSWFAMWFGLMVAQLGKLPDNPPAPWAWNHISVMLGFMFVTFILGFWVRNSFAK